MSNFQLPKAGPAATISASVVDYDGNADLTTVIAITLTPANALTVTPVTPPVGQAVRSWTLTVPTAASLSQTGIQVSATCSIPGTGSGTGAPAAFKSIGYPLIDTVVPVDHRALTGSGPV